MKDPRLAGIEIKSTEGGMSPLHPSATVKIERVTPEMAKALLEGNVDNRKMRAHRVQHYISCLERGEWQLTGDAICITEDERLAHEPETVYYDAAGRFVDFSVRTEPETPASLVTTPELPQVKRLADSKAEVE